MGNRRLVKAIWRKLFYMTSDDMLSFQIGGRWWSAKLIGLTKFLSISYRMLVLS